MAIEGSEMFIETFICIGWFFIEFYADYFLCDVPYMYPMASIKNKRVTAWRC